MYQYKKTLQKYLGLFIIQKKTSKHIMPISHTLLAILVPSPGQNIWHKVKKSSKIEQDIKNLSNLA